MLDFVCVCVCVYMFVCVCVCVWCGMVVRSSPMYTDGGSLFTENVQFSYVSLHCSSAGRRPQRHRNGRRAGEEEGSSITAQFELDVNLEEVTGWSLCCVACLPARLPD